MEGTGTGDTLISSSENCMDGCAKPSDQRNGRRRNVYFSYTFLMYMKMMTSVWAVTYTQGLWIPLRDRQSI